MYPLPIAKNLVSIRKNRATTTSLIVAEHFGKQHKDVLRAIENLRMNLPEDAQRNFALSEYSDSTGRKLPMYEMTRDGFSLLVMGFTGKDALDWKLKFLKAFNRMEAAMTGDVVQQVKSATAVFRECFAMNREMNQSKAAAALAANAAALEVSGIDLLGIMKIRFDDREYDNMTLFNGMVQLMAERQQVRDTFKGMLDCLGSIISPKQEAVRLPSSHRFRNQMERLRPLLSEQGIEFEFGKHTNRGRIIEIEINP